MIVIVAIVTTLIVIGVTLGIIFGYNKNSASETPKWAQDGASR
jgi:ABC-type dipeptide/oligopeptide/nickel transport system permease subunit